IEAGRVHEPAGEPVHLAADRVVLLAEGDQLAQLVFEHLRLLAHGDELALADRHRAPAVRMRHLQVHQDVDVALEEARVLLEEFGDLFRRRALHGISTSPSKTRTASPVIITGATAFVTSPAHWIARSPPRVVTVTSRSSRPRRIPATTAAQ